MDRHQGAAVHMATSVPITPTVLRWAIDTSGLAESEVASRAGVPEPRLSDWLAGHGTPTLTQFKKLAAAVRRPTATLLLPVPPADQTPSVEFRSAASSEQRALNREEQLKLREISRLQRGLVWVRRELGETPVNWPRIDITNAAPAAAARLARQQLGVTPEQQLAWESDSAALKRWREVLEQRGAYAMLAPLGEDSIKGFSLWNDWCPVIVVNTHWNNTARIFTLVHELAHLLTRTNSMCAADAFVVTDALVVNPGDKFERWCESFAAEFLLPWHAVSQFISRSAIGAIDLSAARKVASAFKVSLRATVLRFIDQGIAGWELYNQIPKTADFKGGGGGGTGRKRPQIRFDEYGRNTAITFARGVERDAIDLDDALSYLAVSDHEYGELVALASSPFP